MPLWQRKATLQVIIILFNTTFDVNTNACHFIAGKQSYSQPPQESYDDEDSGSTRKRKKRSRWGNEDPGEKLFIPGMPTILPSNLSKEQEEAYLRKFI
jgi:hypothetical protein